MGAAVILVVCCGAVWGFAWYASERQYVRRALRNIDAEYRALCAQEERAA